MNLAYYSVKFDNVTFRNSIESTIRVSLYCELCVVVLTLHTLIIKYSST